ncbi:MAG: Cardiolipin synthase [Chlamydiae bacterium]|nr:Cardiolipin synthase [Chlamydiota bacterium]
MSSEVNHHVSYKKNTYQATSTGKGRFPVINQLTKRQFKDNTILKVRQLLLHTKLFASLTMTAVGIVGFTVVVGFLPPVAFVTAAIAGGVFGGGYALLIVVTKNATRASVGKDKIFSVCGLKPDTEIEEMPIEAKEVQTLVIPNSKESFEWKKKLIENAEKRIILSGNYCGDKCFDEILDIIREKMETKPELKIVIISSPKFLKESSKKAVFNKSKIRYLEETYPDRFQFVKTGDHYMDSKQGLKKITNHTKALVVDGTHFILGGSGVEDKYAYLEGVGDQAEVRSTGSTGETPGTIAPGLGEGPIGTIPTNSEDGGGFFQSLFSSSGGGLLEFLLPRGFRDMDFLFTGEDAARELDLELLKLARIWEQYNSPGDDIWYKEEILDSRSVVSALIDEEIDTDCAVDAEVLFKGKKLVSGRCKLICSGPEMSDSPYGKTLLEEVEAAKDHIYIDHMYFHPTKELSDLLIRKVNDGVRLTIVTNGNESYSPKGHRMFGPRNRYAYAKIYARVNEENRDLIKVYEFGRGEHNLPKNTTLHKKVIVVDNKVIAGSSNLGYKSTVSSSDHEINFVLESDDAAEATIEVIKDDAFQLLRKAHSDKRGTVIYDDDDNPLSLPLSIKVEDPLKYYTFQYQLLALRHRKSAWLIG